MEREKDRSTWEDEWSMGEEGRSVTENSMYRLKVVVELDEWV